MDVLCVVQRYGEEVAGGAERLCRELSTGLVARGHRVEVLTSCATSYVDWANVLPAGSQEIDGVLVHRLPVSAPRDVEEFGRLSSRVLTGYRPVPLFLQRHWMERQGPLVDGLVPWLQREAPRFDVAAFFTYLYLTTWAGLPVASRLVPTVLHPTAHDEPPLYLDAYQPVFRQADAMAFSTEEEAELVGERFSLPAAFDVIGIGTELAPFGDGEPFRRAYGLGDRPYLVSVGRVDPHKGSQELFDFFRVYKERNPGPLALAIVGAEVSPLPPHPDVVVTGFVDEDVRRAAMAGAEVVVAPSYFESFSIVLIEGWVEGKPALVQGRSEVLMGQARRSGGALPYTGFAEFEAALDLLLEDAALRGALGEAGRRYVEEHYGWDVVLDRYEALLGKVAR